MPLETYRSKRDFEKTPEPAGSHKRHGKKRIFVVQKHAASHLHYDLRLEIDGVLKSWAVPKGPSLNPAVKRLSLEVEDHPYEYKDFEGTIPEGNYGAGEVIVWDTGVYRPADNGPDENKTLRDGLKRGKLSIILEGEKLKGEFELVRMRKPAQWLLLKKFDEHADTKRDVTEKDASVLSSRHLPDPPFPPATKGKNLRTKRASDEAPGVSLQDEN